MKYCTLFIYILLFELTTYAQIKHDDLIIFSIGDSLYCSVIKIGPNYIKIESEESNYIMLKTVVEIQTANSAVVDSLTTNIHGIGVISKGNIFTMDFRNATIPIILREHKHFYRDVSLTLNYSPNDLYRFGFNLNFMFIDLEFLFINIGSSIGDKENYRIYYNFNIELGAGIKYNFDIVSTLLQLKYCRINTLDYQAGNLSENLFLIDMNTRLKLLESKAWYLSFSYLYNLTGTEPGDGNSYNAFLMGVGFDF